jgi:triosephosphate isomerase
MKKIIIGNLKMNLVSPAERERYLESLKKEIETKQLKNSEIVICPPQMHLEKFIDETEKEKFLVGVQNLFWEDRGSFTGETSPLMLKNFGITYCIIGHSERRRFFGETDEIANAKIKAALRNNLSPIYCVGETKEERELGQTNKSIEKQVLLGLKDVPLTQLGKIVIAYEPIWAVGSDLVPKSDEILSVKITIQKIITQHYGPNYMEKIRVVYGGSVNARSAKQVCVEPGMDGVLIGRESLIPSEFMKIAQIIDEE